LRILQVCSVTTFGGGERHLADLSHALADRGHEVYAAAVPGSPLSDELSFLQKGRTFALSRRNYAKNLTGLAGFVRAHNIEIVHAHAARDYHLAALAVRLASRSRLVLTRHALFPLRRINKPLLRGAGRVIAVSQAVAESLRRNGVIESSKITVVHNGIDVDRFADADHRSGDVPVLVGTVSVENSELVAARLAKIGVPHNVLNAKYHEREAEIVAQAGRKGAVTTESSTPILDSVQT